MKTKQTKIDRSGAKWLPGAMALAATTAGAQAATVQITLTGNQISTTGGNTLNADVTGDTSTDLVISNASTRFSRIAQNYGAFVKVNGVRLSAQNYIEGSGLFAVAQFALSGVGLPNDSGYVGTIDIKYLNPISFTDTRINGGNPTQGYLEVNSISVRSSYATVAFTRLIFDDENVTRPTFTEIPDTLDQFVPGAIPEPSSFALLALGAGGLVLRRSRKAKAA